MHRWIDLLITQPRVLFSRQVLTMLKRRTGKRSISFAGAAHDENVTVAANPTQDVSASIDWESYLALTLILGWLSVAIASLLRGIVANWRFAKRLANCECVQDSQLGELLVRECETLQIAKPPVMKVVPELASPALFGIFRSTLCLPTTLDLSQDELRWVLRHEFSTSSKGAMLGCSP